MRIAFAVKNKEISSMDDAQEAIIFEDGRMTESFNLDNREDHPGIYKMMQIIRKKVGAVVTQRCGPPGFRLTESHNMKIFMINGNIETIVKGIEEGSIFPSKAEDAARGHHDHHT